MLNIVLPIGGRGKRFLDAGYQEIKPLIKINGKTMLELVLDNIGLKGGKFIFVANKRHLEEFGEEIVSSIRNTFITDYELIPELEMKGAASGVLQARYLIDSNDELIIANVDQLVGKNDVSDAVSMFEKEKRDGGILCFFNRETKWSYASLDDQGLVSRVAEKDPISDNATVGIYYYRRGHDFVSCADEMILQNDTYNGEFYVCPVFNYMIRRGLKIKPYFVNHMQGLGTPEDLGVYLK